MSVKEFKENIHKDRVEFIDCVKQYSKADAAKLMTVNELRNIFEVLVVIAKQFEKINDFVDSK